METPEIRPMKVQQTLMPEPIMSVRLDETSFDHLIRPYEHPLRQKSTARTELSGESQNNETTTFNQESHLRPNELSFQPEVYNQSQKEYSILKEEMEGAIARKHSQQPN